MRTNISRTDACVLLSLTITLAFSSPGFGGFPAPPAPYTHVAISDGGWQRPENWDVGQIPGDGAIVHIPEGRQIAIVREETARHRFIRVDGNLRHVIARDTRLLVETLYVGPTGSFTMGLPLFRVHADRTAEVVFTSSGPIDLAWDPFQRSRGLISDGAVHLYGAIKTPFVTMTRDALAGDPSLEVDKDLNAIGANWQAGDEIVVTGTYFRRGEESREEKRTIQLVSGYEVVLDQPLAFDHIRASDSFSLHVANLTRNVTLRSETTANCPSPPPPALDCPPPALPPSGCSDRGHVMFRNSDVDISQVAFVNLGRTDKTRPLDDTVVAFDELTCAQVNGKCSCDYTGEVFPPVVSEIQNPRGRYAVHFHRNGLQPGVATPPSSVHDSVVVGTPGWGFVNHSSHVDFQRNIAYDFAGAAFVTEAGDELGNFIGNLAIRGTGNGEYRPARIMFQNFERPQALADFGFSGDGFWFQGPAIRVRDNIANGCNGAGMIWFTTGAPDVTDIGLDNRNNYTGFPDTALQPTYGHFPDFAAFEGRHWNHAPNRLVVSDLPILECVGFEAYANLVGFRFRFHNLDNNDWYTEDPFNYDLDIVGIPGQGNRFAVRMRETVRDLVLWNNEQAFRSRYSSLTDFEKIVAVNRLDFGNSARFAGGELNFQIFDTTLADITIDGYPIAGWIDDDDDDVPNQLTFLTPQDYSNYVMFDTCKGCINGVPNGLCPSVGPISKIPNSTSVQLSWPVDPAHERYLARYWIEGEDVMRFEESEASGLTLNMNLPGLEPNTTYRYQVLAGCEEVPSALWSPIPAGTVTTLP